MYRIRGMTMGEDKKKKSIMSAVGSAISRAGELGVKTGDAIKDFAESGQAEKMADGVKKGAKATANNVSKGAKLAVDGVATGTQKAVDNIKAAAEDNAKKKAEKKELRKEIKAELEAEKTRIKEDKTNETNHTVLEMKKQGMRFLIPDGYEKLKVRKTGDPRFDKAKEKYVYGKSVSTCDGAVIVFETSEDEAMKFGDKQGVIDGIHECMSDRQGVICVESGRTERGYDYIYSIVKTVKEEMFAGVMYYLRMNIGYKGKIIEVQGSFDEARETGVRESLSKELAHRAGLCEFSNFDGWSEDPYDPEYNKGFPMNLAERAGMDCFFPDNPLSQAREFLRAFLFDELMEEIEDGPLFKQKDEPDPNMSEEEIAKKETEKKEHEKELLLPLFDKGEYCKRHRYTVIVN